MDRFRVVVAPDKFRGSLTAVEAAGAMARGVEIARPGTVVDRVPMADGGEGTVEALVAATGGAYREVRVAGPMGGPVLARYGLLGDRRTAVLEMAAASGLALVPSGRRDPTVASTRGTGELLRAAVGDGVRHVILGIGGSATNDGGAGLAQALGFRLLDAEGRDLPPGGGALNKLRRIEPPESPPPLDGIEVSVACDVDNPLCGPRGASMVYGPQKGATPADIERLDANLHHFAAIVERDLGVAIRDVPGAGAAGGLGGGLLAFAGGTLRRGIELVIEAVGLADRLEGADLCLTGEGSLDASTAHGKTAVGVARCARERGVPTFALAGVVTPEAGAVHGEGIAAYFSICPGPIPLDRAIAEAAILLERATAEAVRAFLAGLGR